MVFGEEFRNFLMFGELYNSPYDTYGFNYAISKFLNSLYEIKIMNDNLQVMREGLDTGIKAGFAAEARWL